MKMEVLAVQQQYQSQYAGFASNKVKDWTSTLTPPTKIQTAAKLPYLQRNTTNKMKNSINKKSNRTVATELSNKIARPNANNNNNNNVAKSNTITNNYCYNNSVATAQQQQQQQQLLNCDNIDVAAVSELSMRLLDELRAAKTRHLSCTEVSIPCDLTPRIATEIIRVSDKEPCGIRGCTIYFEFEDQPNNSRRIATLKLDAEMVSTFEVYLTLRQDHRGWTALLPQFMKSLARTITISPEFTITKHKLYSPHEVTFSRSISINYNNGIINSNNSNSSSSSRAIATPTS